MLWATFAMIRTWERTERGIVTTDGGALLPPPCSHRAKRYKRYPSPEAQDWVAKHPNVIL